LTAEELAKVDSRAKQERKTRSEMTRDTLVAHIA
jgi:hypothetical protein